MKIFPSIETIPDTISFECDKATFTFNGTASKRINDIELNIINGKYLLTAQSTPVYRIRLRWNTAFPQDTLFCGDAWERGYGDFEWRGFVPDRVMPWYFMAAVKGHTAGYGVKTLPDAMCCFLCDSKGITLLLDVSNGNEAVILKGKTIGCAEIVCKEYAEISAYEASCRFAKLLCLNPVFPDKPVYGFNNWYYAYGRSSQEEIISDTQYLARLTENLENRPYMIIDDCWQKNRTDSYIGGPWREGNRKFPNMKKLAESISSYNVIPGIWIRPLQNADEKITQKQNIHGDADILDASSEAVLEWIAEDIRTITGWGYKLIKYDFSTYDIFGKWGYEMKDRPAGKESLKFSDKSKTNAMIIKDLYRTIYEAADKKALILGCNCIGHLAVGFMEINRTGDDTSGVQWERTRKMGINTLAFRMHQHNAFFAVDADCAGITNKISWEKNRQWLYLLANSGTPLFVSAARQDINEAQEKELQQLLAVSSLPHDRAIPLDCMNNVCPEKWLISDKIIEFDWFENSGTEKII